MQQTHTMPVEELNRLNEKEVKELVASSETAFRTVSAAWPRNLRKTGINTAL